jgi:hypothetical protein
VQLRSVELIIIIIINTHLFFQQAPCAKGHTLKHRSTQVHKTAPPEKNLEGIAASQSLGQLWPQRMHAQGIGQQR